jgi:hypothetical protein
MKNCIETFGRSKLDPWCDSRRRGRKGARCSSVSRGLSQASTAGLRWVTSAALIQELADFVLVRMFQISNDLRDEFVEPVFRHDLPNGWRAAQNRHCVLERSLETFRARW